MTRGRVTAYQEIAFVVCPRVGGNRITAPVATTQTVFTPKYTHWYKVIDRGATGTAANANYTAWQIEDVFESCGVF